MSVSIPSRAEQLIMRLAHTAAAYDKPLWDEAVVERAIREHLRRLGVEGLTVRFVTDFGSSRESAIAAALDADAWITPWRRAWRQARRDAWSSAPWRVVRRLAEVSARRAVAMEAWTQVRELLSPGPAATMDPESMQDWVSEQALFDALEAAVEVVSWSAEPEISRPIERWIEILSPVVDAFDAGLWLCWMTPGQARPLLRPAVRFANRRLHCEDGPAITWPEGPSYYCWNGVRVPQKVIHRPLDLTAHEIASEGDVEVRRVMLERYGSERFIQDLGAILVHVDETGELYRQEFPNDEPLCMVRVLDATPGPSGTRRAYWLRVPPTVGTAREAVAWTFSMEPSQYRPVHET